MIIQLLFIIFLLFSPNINLSADGNQFCSINGVKLYGKVQFVNSFSDIKIQYVSSFPDMKVKMVKAFPRNCGEWQPVESFPDFKVQIVTSFPNLTIKKVMAFPGMN
ncbi:MAG: hypothetical protein KAG26_00105 [Methylococcales bacterium]|nr:hypothetical protein [Methylococcales bacterium]